MSQIDIVPAYFPTIHQLYSRALVVNKAPKSAENRRPPRYTKISSGLKGHAKEISHISESLHVSIADAEALYGTAAKLVRALSARYACGHEPTASRVITSSLRRMTKEDLRYKLLWIVSRDMVQSSSRWHGGIDLKIMNDVIEIRIAIRQEPKVALTKDSWGNDRYGIE